MYRVIKMTNKTFAVELETSGRSLEDEMEEIEAFLDTGSEVILTMDYEEYDAELVERDYL